MKRFFALALTCTFGLASYAQLVTDNTLTPQQLVNNILIGGGVTASSIQFTGDTDAIGYFDANNANVGINSGILLTTGTVQDIPAGPHGPRDFRTRILPFDQKR